MAARGFAGKWLTEARPLATGAGALFVRSYERGERVHAAMLSRGFTGGLPSVGLSEARRESWSQVAIWAAAVIATAVGARVL